MHIARSEGISHPSLNFPPIASTLPTSLNLLPSDELITTPLKPSLSPAPAAPFPFLLWIILYYSMPLIAFSALIGVFALIIKGI